MIDKYIDFCQKALLPPNSHTEGKIRPTLVYLLRTRQRCTQPTHNLIERGVLGEYFPLPTPTSTSSASAALGTAGTNMEQPSNTSHPSHPTPPQFSAVHVHEDSTELTPGQAYAIFDTKDVLGVLPPELDLVVRQAAKWAGVEEELVCGVVERYERRLVRWWDGRKQKERKRGKGKGKARERESEEASASSSDAEDTP